MDFSSVVLSSFHILRIFDGVQFIKVWVPEKDRLKEEFELKFHNKKFNCWESQDIPWTKENKTQNGEKSLLSVPNQNIFAGEFDRHEC